MNTIRLIVNTASRSTGMWILTWLLSLPAAGAEPGIDGPFHGLLMPVIAIIDTDRAEVIERVVATLKNLEGVKTEVSSEQPLFSQKPWELKHPERSSYAANLKQLDITVITIAWLPPPAPAQRITTGGKNIRPLNSEIEIYIASLKGSSRPIALRFVRGTDYNVRLHLPDTPIPLWRDREHRDGSYESDRRWIKSLSPGKETFLSRGGLVYANEVVAALSATK